MVAWIMMNPRRISSTSGFALAKNLYTNPIPIATKWNDSANVTDLTNFPGPGKS